MLKFQIKYLPLLPKQKRLRHKVILNSSKITVGEISSVYGLKGWFRVRSYTEKAKDILNFTEVFLSDDKNTISVKIDDSKRHNKGFLIHIDGIDEPEKAALYCNYKIQVEKKILPTLGNNEFYWHQLQGLQVINQNYKQSKYFGVIDFIFETGANDVLVVKREKNKDVLVPYLFGDVIKEINLNKKTMTIDWLVEE